MRHSILSNAVNPMLYDMMRKTTMLQLHESDLNIMRLLKNVVGATQDAVRILEDSRATHHPFSIDTSSRLTLAIPVDKWVGLRRPPTDSQDVASNLYSSFAWVNNKYQGIGELESGRLPIPDTPLASFESFVKATMAYHPPAIRGTYPLSPGADSNRLQRILTLPLELKESVPVTYCGPPSSDIRISCRYLCLVTRDGPYGFTDDEWRTIQKEVVAIHNKIVELNYLFDIGKAVAGWCTTPGIIKRVWPDAVNFLSSDSELRDRVKEASPSALPAGLRRRLLGFRDSMGPDGYGYKELTEGDLRKITSKVTDSILASLLMPEFKELSQRKEDGYEVMGVQINQLTT